MAPDARFEIATRLAASAEQVYAWALTPEGINHELGPWLRMTMPKSIPPGMTIEEAPLGEKLGRSWILLAGVIPVDYDDLTLAERGPGFRFLERSQLGSAKAWQHERVVVATGAATCAVTDRLELELRAPLRVLGGSAIARRVLRALFTHRHRRLRRRWGEDSGPEIR
ncbi:MAG: hypothetical protein M3383_03140 [Actinomycetota bacterium]|nr:hypothetical protein [Actinomycetota bacterium]